MRLFFRRSKKHEEAPKQPDLLLGCTVLAPPSTVDYRLDPWALAFHYHERYSEVAVLKKEVLNDLNTFEALPLGKSWGAIKLGRPAEDTLPAVRRALRHLTLPELPHFMARLDNFLKRLREESWGAYTCESERLAGSLRQLAKALERAYPVSEPGFLRQLKELFWAPWLLKFRSESLSTSYIREEDDGFMALRFLMADVALGREVPAQEWLSALVVARRHNEGKLTEDSQASLAELFDAAEVFFLLRSGMTHASS